MTIEVKDKFKIITADEGMVLTEWQRGDDILNYSYSIKQYVPLSFDPATLNEITNEENEKLIAEQEIRIIEIEKENNG